VFNIDVLETIMRAGFVVNDLGIDHDAAWQHND
jgi:hypothetical protein